MGGTFRCCGCHASASARLRRASTGLGCTDGSRGRAAYSAMDERAAAAATAATAATGGGKFSGVFTLSCGEIEAFYKGLAGRLGTLPLAPPHTLTIIYSSSALIASARIQRIQFVRIG